MLRRAFGLSMFVSFACAELACGDSRAPLRAPLERASLADASANPPDAREHARHGPTTTEVHVSLMDHEGSAWGALASLTPDPVAMVKHCLGETGSNPLLQGFALFDLAMGGLKIAKATRVVDLPAPLVKCIEEGLGKLDLNGAAFDRGGVVYVSIGLSD